jgi:Mg2+/Co2+ transporter CorC
MNQYPKIVELLLESGASCSVENKEHLKPIDVVPESDHVTRQLLKNYKARKYQVMYVG